MKVLVACECSGRTRRAFQARGHEVWSCDLKPAEDSSPYHFQGDVFRFVSLMPSFDLMVAHPTCTYLTNSGARWLYLDGNSINGIDHDRWAQMIDGINFFNRLGALPIPKMALENPIMHKYARHLISDCYATQIIQPWWFGEPVFKATCFHTRGLPALTPTNKLTPPKSHTADHRANPGPQRATERSRTFAGISAAMADQWGC